MDRVEYRTHEAELSTGTDLRQEFRGEPFTGELYEAIGTEILWQTWYVDGIAHGPDLEWWGPRQPQSQGYVYYGQASGIWRRWHSNWQLAEERFFDDRYNLVEVRTWDRGGNRIHPNKRRGR